MKHQRRHRHDWQWADRQECYICRCGDLKSPEPEVAPQPITIRPQLDSTVCWSCLGSGYSDYAIGQPCQVCAGWGHFEHF